MEWKKNLFCFLAAIMGLGGVLPSLMHWTTNAHVIVTEAWKSEIRFRWLIRAAGWVFFLFMVIKRVLVAETCITTNHSTPLHRPPLSHNLSRPLSGLQVPHSHLMRCYETNELRPN